VCARGCLGHSHPGPTGLLITLSVTWHLLRRGEWASSANMGIAALSLSLVSVGPSCSLAPCLLDSIYMYDWFSTWTVLFMTSSPNKHAHTHTHTHTHTHCREKHPSWPIFNQPWDTLRCLLCSSRLGHFLSSCLIRCSVREKHSFLCKIRVCVGGGGGGVVFSNLLKLHFRASINIANDVL